MYKLGYEPPEEEVQVDPQVRGEGGECIYEVPMQTNASTTI